MKKLIFIFSLLVASVTYANNSAECLEVNQVVKTEGQYSFSKNKQEKPLDCTTTVTSTVKTNRDGSTTRTTTTTTNCDTPQELAQFHALMASLGMGV